MNVAMDNNGTSVFGSEDSLHSQEERSADDRSQSYENSVQDRNNQNGEEEQGEQRPIDISMTPITWKDYYPTLDCRTLEVAEASLGETEYIIPISTRLHRRNLLVKLGDVLTSRLTVANCLFLYGVASPSELYELRAACHEKICKNFASVPEMSASFRNLSFEELRYLVFVAELHATEEQVFDAIVLWIKSDLHGRKPFIAELIPAIKINRCSLKFLRRAIKNPLTEALYGFLKAALERILYLTSRNPNVDCYGEEGPCRAGDRDIFFVMGGLASMNTVETMDPSRDSWVAHNISDPPSDNTFICSMGHKILVLESENKRFRSYDVINMLWEQLRPPQFYRIGSSISSYDHYVYLLGGEKPYGTRCDRYDASTDRWEEMAPMTERRDWAAATCHASKLYCAGGLYGTLQKVRSSLEVLDPLGEGQWSRLPPFRVGRAKHSLVSCGRFLWTIGGWNRLECITAVERFDVERCLWNHVQPLDTPRSDLSACVLGRRIYVIGGRTTGYISLWTTEVYDVEEGRWSYVASLNEEREIHGSCVVRSLLEEDADKYAVSQQ